MTGDELRENREGAGLSVKEFAELAGVDPRTIDRIEKGETNPSATVLHKVQRLMKVLEQPEGSSAADAAAVAKARYSISLGLDLGAAIHPTTPPWLADAANISAQSVLQSTIDSMTVMRSAMELQTNVSQQIAEMATSAMASITSMASKLISPMVLPNFTFPTAIEQIANQKSLEDSLQYNLVVSLASAKKVAGDMPDSGLLGQTVRDAISKMGFDTASAAVAAMGFNRVQEAINAMGFDKAVAAANTGLDGVRDAATLGFSTVQAAAAAMGFDSVQKAAAGVGQNGLLQAATGVGQNVVQQAAIDMSGRGDAVAMYSHPSDLAMRAIQLQAETEQRRDENIARRIVAGIASQLGSAAQRRSADNEGRMATLEARLKAYEELSMPSGDEQADADPTNAILVWIAQAVCEDTEAELEQLRQHRGATKPD